MPKKFDTLIRSPRTGIAVRALGAILLLFVGADHYYEYSADGYSVVPTIGTLFLLNFASATLIGLILLAPVKRIFRRSGAIVLRAATLAGCGIAATSLIALLVSEHTSVFGFMEFGYRPAIIVAIASEAAAAACLTLLFILLLANGDRARAVRRQAGDLYENPRHA